MAVLGGGHTSTTTQSVYETPAGAKGAPADQHVDTTTVVKDANRQVIETTTEQATTHGDGSKTVHTETKDGQGQVTRSVDESTGKDSQGQKTTDYKEVTHTQTGDTTYQAHTRREEQRDYGEAAGRKVRRHQRKRPARFPWCKREG